MIESIYWKKELLSHAKRLKPVSKPPRWSEKLACSFEREIIISFFCIRKLFETYKVSSVSRSYKMQVYVSEANGTQRNLFNRYMMDELYDMENEKLIHRDIWLMTNQFVHSYIIYPYRKRDRNWGGIFVCSDFEKDRLIYRVSIEEVQKVFRIVGNDYSSEVTRSYDAKGNIVTSTN